MSRVDSNFGKASLTNVPTVQVQCYSIVILNMYSLLCAGEKGPPGIIW